MGLGVIPRVTRADEVVKTLKVLHISNSTYAFELQREERGWALGPYDWLSRPPFFPEKSAGIGPSGLSPERVSGDKPELFRFAYGKAKLGGNREFLLVAKRGGLGRIKFCGTLIPPVKSWLSISGNLDKFQEFTVTMLFGALLTRQCPGKHFCADGETFCTEGLFRHFLRDGVVRAFNILPEARKRVIREIGIFPFILCYAPPYLPNILGEASGLRSHVTQRYVGLRESKAASK
jgi:hypothetical protein